MAAGTIDTSRDTLIFGEYTGPPSGDGTFITVEIPATVENGATMGDGQAMRKIMQRGAVSVVVTCGMASDWHRIFGIVWNEQEALRLQRQRLPGRNLTSRRPTNGDSLTGREAVIMQAPTHVLGDEEMMEWTLSVVDVTVRYGELVPVGGGTA
jgi:hypothetical protein